MATSDNDPEETIIIPDLGPGVQVIEMDQTVFENCAVVDVNVANSQVISGTSGTTTAFVLNPDTGELLQLVELSELVSSSSDHAIAGVHNQHGNGTASAALEVTLVDDMMANNNKQLEAVDKIQTPIEIKYLPTSSVSGQTEPKVVRSPVSRMKNAPALLRNSRRNLNGDAASTPNDSVPAAINVPSSNGSHSNGKQRRGNKLKSTAPAPDPSVSTVPHIIIVNGNGEEIALVDLPNTIVNLQDIISSVNDNDIKLTNPTASAPGLVIYQTEGKDGQQQEPTSVDLKDLNSKSKSSKIAKPNKTPKRSKKAETPKKPKDLKCMEPGCPGEAANIVELRTHLVEEHDMSLDSETMHFPNDSAFNEWREQYERERMVSFIYRGGTKKISKENSVTYMVCHRSGHYKPTMIDTSKRQRRLKPQGSCKIGGYCTAGIKKMKNLESGQVKAEICHTHYGHPLDSEAIPHLRVNPALKKIILKKFEEGMTFPDMLAYIHHNPDGLEGLRVVDRRAVRNIYEQWKKPEGHGHSRCHKVQEEESNNSSTHLIEEEEITAESEKRVPEDGIVATDEEDQNSSPLHISISSIESLKTPTTTATELKSKLPRKRKIPSEKGEILVKAKKKAKSSRSSPSKPTYQLRPNRKVEVFKKRKSKAHDPHSDLDISETEDTECNDSPLLSLSSSQSQSDLEVKIERLHNHGESGPTILLYKRIGDNLPKYGESCRAFKEDEFCLIIQTPVQRQIMQMFSKIVCVEMLENHYAQDNPLKLAYVSVVDDFREAIPVAWMVCDSMSFKYLNQFFKALRHHCGELPVRYLMAPRNSDVYRAWTSHFSSSTKPNMLQNEYCVKRELRNLLNRHIPIGSMRDEAWGILKKIMYGKDPESIPDLKRDLAELVKDSANSHGYMQKLGKEWLSRKEEWSFSYRVGASPNLQFISDGFTKLRKFVSFKGTKRLNQSIDHILKIGYDKCFLRTKRMFKGDQKFSHLLEKIEEYHVQARDSLKNSTVETGGGNDGDQSWVVDGSFQVFHLQSPCDCKVQCRFCNVCIHEYACSCDVFRQGHVMCEHVHKVHCHLNGFTLELEGDNDTAPEIITENLPGPREVNDLGILDEDFRAPGVLCDGQQITIINESEIDAIDISEVLQAAGLFDGGSNNGNEVMRIVGGGQIASVPKIISISEAVTAGQSEVSAETGSGCNNVLEVGETEFGQIVFRLE